MLAERESQNTTLLKPSLLVTGHIFKAMDKKEITATVLIDLVRHLVAYVIGHSFLSCKGWVCKVMRRSGLRATPPTVCSQHY